MVDDSHKTRHAVETILRVFGMWGHLCFGSLTDAVKMWVSRKEQEVVVQSITNLLEGPLPESLTQWMEISLSFAIMFINRAHSIMVPHDKLCKTVHMIFQSYMDTDEIAANYQFSQQLLYIRETQEHPLTIADTMVSRYILI